ncbi:hypothetical protein [Tomitella fengzijianii]|uniref:hypothetical protein n=1 Tax=Tomitella fengzijianii TaxID=2597660 RepID=UPI00131D241D|nr:hypothetical protein [Tomitella fengzijianii]
MGRHSRTEAAAADVRWFWGIDGQVILDDEYVWIAREWLVDAGRPRPPQRARLADVTGVSAAEVDGGEKVLVQIQVDGAEPDDFASPSPTDAVLFDLDEGDICVDELMAHEQIIASLRLLAEFDARQPEVHACWQDGRIESALRLALGAREAIATKDEIVQAILASEHVTDPDARAELERIIESCTADGDVTWIDAGPTTVAIGGSRAYKATRHDPLRKIVERYAKAQKDSRRRSTSYAKLDEGLKKMLTGGRYRSLKVSLGLQPPRKASAAKSSKATKRVAKPAARQRPRPADAVPGKARPTPSSAHILPSKTAGLPASAAVGDRVRVYLDHDGFRTIGVFNPATGGVRISKGELKGHSFSGPTAAAAAVIERIAPGTPAPDDGWALWRVHDTSMTALGKHAGRACS